MFSIINFLFGCGSERRHRRSPSLLNFLRSDFWGFNPSSEDKGNHGEYLIYKRLRHLEDSGSKFLFNVYIPKNGTQKTEIDVLMISLKGLFVFESKNFSGWIFGNESHTNWTQTLPLGRGHCQKERFYNPIMQNASHIKYLRRFMSICLPVHSIIVFADGCTFKDVTVKSKDVRVVHLCDVESTVVEISSQTQEDLLTMAEIGRVYNLLYPMQKLMNEKDSAS